jgi:hypothetical protein
VQQLLLGCHRQQRLLLVTPLLTPQVNIMHPAFLLLLHLRTHPVLQLLLLFLILLLLLLLLLLLGLVLLLKLLQLLLLLQQQLLLQGILLEQELQLQAMVSLWLHAALIQAGVGHSWAVCCHSGRGQGPCCYCCCCCFSLCCCCQAQVLILAL